MYQTKISQISFPTADTNNVTIHESPAFVGPSLTARYYTKNYAVTG